MGTSNLNVLSNNKIFLQVEIFDKNYKKVYKKLKTYQDEKIIIMCTNFYTLNWLPR